MEKKHESRRKQENKKSVFLLIIIIFITIVGTVIFILNSRKDANEANITSEILGTWTTDGYTVYEFNENGNGKLVIPIADYEFSYRIEENKIYIDFKNEISTDSDYEYSFEDGKLILKGINKTTGTYEFTKK